MEVRRRETVMLEKLKSLVVAGPSKSPTITTDFVLVYKETADGEKTLKRVSFERALLETGLIISTVTISDYNFVKVNVPLEVMYRYGELLQLRMPIKLDRSISRSLSGVMVIRFLSFLNVRKSGPQMYTLMTEFKRDRLDLFDLENPQFFSTPYRTYVASYILDRASYEENKSGIQSLIIDGVYLNAYPLHDGSPYDQDSKRYLLLKNWASLRNFFKNQPLDDIRFYFGSNFALFFTWQGFYTFMLLPVAVIGCITFFFGFAIVHANGLILDICESNYTMCPKCDKYCPYWQLSSICEQAQITYTMDNWAAIPLSVFFSVWGALYLLLWKRYMSHIAYNWGLTHCHDSAEPSRPQYLRSMAKSKNVKLNIVTLQPEPYLPFWKKKFPIYVFSTVVLFVMAIFYICTYIAINVYQMVMVYASGSHDTIEMKNSVKAIFYCSTLASFFIIYICFNKFARLLTNLEKHRTQTQYENSLYLKYFALEFVLFYTGVIYSTYLKSRYFGRPGKYKRIFGYRPIECLIEGCQFDIMLYTVMFLVIKQIMFIFSITLVPIIQLHYSKVMKVLWRRSFGIRKEHVPYNQMMEDKDLLDARYLDVYNGYLHTTIEFGFITMFGVAFPLVPLMALLCNALTIRLAAYIYLKYYKRPVPRIAPNIGIWLNITDFISKLAVITNSFILAISPKFIPHVVFRIAHLSEFTGRGLLKNTITSYNTSELEEGTQPDDGIDVGVCYYFDYRYPHDHPKKYEKTLYYWKVLVARLTFIVCYHIVLYMILNLLYLVIPETPQNISDKIQMEAYHINKAILKSEKKRNAIR